MTATLQTQLKPARAATPSFTPVRSGLLQRKCACGGTPGPTGECEECRKKKLQLRPGNLPAPSAISHQPSTASQVPPIVHEVLRSPGQPLDAATRAFMERRFRHDFGQVRVHTDLKSAQSARAVNALAYTVGRDVVFGLGQYSPGTMVGKRLLAHEFTHVIQQSDQPMPKRHGINSRNDHYEHEANRMGDSIVAGRQIPGALLPLTRCPAPYLQRSEESEGGRERSRQSKPKNAPRGTKPIDESGLDKEDVHGIKDGIGAGPKDWVGITPEGEVITTDAEGNAENHGPASDYLKEAHPEIPGWVWPLLIVAGIVVVAGIIACFATGVCEFAAIVAGLSYATALLIIGLLKRAGIRDSGGGPIAASEAQAELSEEMG